MKGSDHQHIGGMRHPVVPGPLIDLRYTKMNRRRARTEPWSEP